jgi:hypothetical protein
MITDDEADARWNARDEIAEQYDRDHDAGPDDD